MSARHHEAVRVRVGNRQAQIDRDIAPLIREIWGAGIETIMSCQQDGSGRVWVHFSNISNGVRFLNIVARYEPGPGNLYARMHPRFEFDETVWWYEVHEDDFALHDEARTEERYEGPPDFFFTFTVRFPPADLPEVVERLREYNRLNKKTKNST